MSMDSYEQIADMFMGTLFAQAWGGTREEFITRLKAKWPSEAIAVEHVAGLLEQARALQVRVEREAAARGAKVIGIAYPVDDKHDGN
jgi:hypothetical protein